MSEELGQKLRRVCGGKRPPQAVAVKGLGGTGKTQLVLRYIQEHDEEYKTVLWLQTFLISA